MAAKDKKSELKNDQIAETGPSAKNTSHSIPALLFKLCVSLGSARPRASLNVNLSTLETVKSRDVKLSDFHQIFKKMASDDIQEETLQEHRYKLFLHLYRLLLRLEPDVSSCQKYLKFCYYLFDEQKVPQMQLEDRLKNTEKFTESLITLAQNIKQLNKRIIIPRISVGKIRKIEPVFVESKVVESLSRAKGVRWQQEISSITVIPEHEVEVQENSIQSMLTESMPLEEKDLKILFMLNSKVQQFLNRSSSLTFHGDFQSQLRLCTGTENAEHRSRPPKETCEVGCQSVRSGSEVCWQSNTKTEIQKSVQKETVEIGCQCIKQLELSNKEQQTELPYPVFDQCVQTCRSSTSSGIPKYSVGTTLNDMFPKTCAQKTSQGESTIVPESTAALATDCSQYNSVSDKKAHFLLTASEETLPEVVYTAADQFYAQSDSLMSLHNHFIISTSEERLPKINQTLILTEVTKNDVAGVESESTFTVEEEEELVLPISWPNRLEAMEIKTPQTSTSATNLPHFTPHADENLFSLDIAQLVPEKPVKEIGSSLQLKSIESIPRPWQPEKQLEEEQSETQQLPRGDAPQVELNTTSDLDSSSITSSKTVQLNVGQLKKKVEFVQEDVSFVYNSESPINDSNDNQKPRSVPLDVSIKVLKRTMDILKKMQEVITPIELDTEILIMNPITKVTEPVRCKNQIKPVEERLPEQASNVGAKEEAIPTKSSKNASKLQQSKECLEIEDMIQQLKGHLEALTPGPMGTESPIVEETFHIPIETLKSIMRPKGIQPKSSISKLMERSIDELELMSRPESMHLRTNQAERSVSALEKLLRDSIEQIALLTLQGQTFLTVPQDRRNAERSSVEVPQDRKNDEKNSIEVPQNRNAERSFELSQDRINAEKSSIEVSQDRKNAERSIKVPQNCKNAERNSIEVPQDRKNAERSIKVPQNCKNAERNSIEVPLHRRNAEGSIEVSQDRKNAERSIEVPQKRKNAERNSIEAETRTASNLSKVSENTTRQCTEAKSATADSTKQSSITPDSATHLTDPLRSRKISQEMITKIRQSIEQLEAITRSAAIPFKVPTELVELIAQPKTGNDKGESNQTTLDEVKRKGSIDQLESLIKTTFLSFEDSPNAGMPDKKVKVEPVLKPTLVQPTEAKVKATKWEHQRHVIAASSFVINQFKCNPAYQCPPLQANGPNLYEQWIQFKETVAYEASSRNPSINVSAIRKRFKDYLRSLKSQYINAPEEYFSVVSKGQLNQFFTQTEQLHYDHLRWQQRDRGLSVELTPEQRLQDALHALLGYEGQQLRVSIKGRRLMLRSPHHQRNISESYLLLALGEVGFYYRSLQDQQLHLQQLGECGRALTPCLLAELLDYSSFHQSQKSQASSLIKLFWQTRSYLKRFQWMLELCGGLSGQRSLLQQLQLRLGQGYPDQDKVLQTWLQSAAEPLMARMSSWLQMGEVPSGEFFIKEHTYKGLEHFWQQFKLLPENLPHFLNPSLAIQLLQTGRNQHYARRFMGTQLQLPVPTSELERRLAIACASSYRELDEQPLQELAGSLARETSRQLFKRLQQLSPGPLELFSRLHQYLLLTDVEFVRELIELLEPALEQPLEHFNAEQLNSMLEQLLWEHNDQLYVVRGPDQGSRTWCCFLLRWELTDHWRPLLGNHLETYESSFTCLWQLHYADYVLNERIRRQQSHFWERINLEYSLDARQVRDRFDDFIDRLQEFMMNLRGYMLDDVLACAFERIFNACNTAYTLDELLEIHGEYLASIQRGLCLKGSPWFYLQQFLSELYEPIFKLDIVQQKFLSLCHLFDVEGLVQRIKEVRWSCQNTCDSIHDLEKTFQHRLANCLYAFHSTGDSQLCDLALRLDQYCHYEHRFKNLKAVHTFGFQRKWPKSKKS